MANLTDKPPEHEYLSLGSTLLTSFEQFILCLFIHMMSLVSTTIDWSTVMEANHEVSYQTSCVSCKTLAVVDVREAQFPSSQCWAGFISKT